MSFLLDDATVEGSFVPYGIELSGYARDIYGRWVRSGYVGNELRPGSGTWRGTRTRASACGRSAG